MHNNLSRGEGEPVRLLWLAGWPTSPMWSAPGQGNSYPKKQGVQLLRLFPEYNIDTCTHTWTCTHTVYLSESELFRRISLSFIQSQMIRDLNYTYKVLSSSQGNVKPYCHILSSHKFYSCLREGRDCHDHLGLFPITVMVQETKPSCYILF